jgi:hypothetical protein
LIQQSRVGLLFAQHAHNGYEVGEAGKDDR